MERSTTESKRKSIYINWREKCPEIFENYKAENQGNTETCWAFAVSFCVSVLAATEHGVPRDNNWKLSVQELVDRVCQVYKRHKIQAYRDDIHSGNKFVFEQDKNGTYGVITEYAFMYCKEFGLSYAYAYPFAGRRNLGKSMPSEDEVPRVYISDYEILNGSASDYMDEILTSLEKQPLVGKIYSTQEFVHSKIVYLGRESGVELKTKIGDDMIDTPAHMIVILGYIGSMDCFLILNFWGEDFGDAGYLLVSSHLLFDVGWPKLSIQWNTECDFQSRPRRRQLREHIVTGSSNILAATKQVRNEAAEDFLRLLKEWQQLHIEFGLLGSKQNEDEASETISSESNKDEDKFKDSSVSTGEFEVQRLLDVCYGDPNMVQKPGLYFKVCWKGYGPSDDTWEPIDGLGNCEVRIKDFVTSGYKTRKLPLPVHTG